MAKASDTPIGRKTVAASIDVVCPRLVMTCTMIRPTTSSIMAALVSTTPSRLSVRPLVLRTVKVVPSDVEQSAAPAANACKASMLSRPCKTYDNAIGALMPIIATVAERYRFARRVVRFVDKPPVIVVSSMDLVVQPRPRTFIYYQYQPEIPKLHDAVLYRARQPVRSGRSIGDADKYLADETAVDDTIKNPVDGIEQQQE